ncbi:NAD-dependent epimerase/dehydratase family protein [Nocardia arizonensis]|uniref:NAD-dependent epimerase/dehydratase family protein n=1 Tax=Nocardia arizonensis TaxID=1141647 RepID=UPI0006D02440|nr:NAD-dependent epimerase/dehydratase family protein [Nocardia arizonensis]
MRVLVLGGSNLIGPALVSELIGDGAEVTIANRGITPDSFGDSVERVRIERGERAALRTLAATGPWDVVYDQICYTAEQAEAACDCFAGRVGRYVFTSSIMVYEPGPARGEAAFDPNRFRAEVEPSALPEHLRYGEGKRAAEAAFFQRADFPVAAVRFPNILGSDDRSRRLDWHIQAVRTGSPVFVPNPGVRQSLLWSRDAGRFLTWLGGQRHTGPVNAASSDPISVGDLLETVAAMVGSPVVHAEQPTAGNFSPFGFSEDFTIDTRLVRAWGFEFTDVARWLPALVAEQVAKGPRRSRDLILHGILRKLHHGESLTPEEVERLDQRLESLRVEARSNRQGPWNES